MRFYSRVTATFYITVLNAVLLTVGGVFGRHRFLDVLLAVLWFFLGGSAILTQILTYWELHHDGLYERRLFRKRTIPFDQIASVKSESPTGKLAPGWLKVFYTSPFPSFDTDQNAIDRGTLLLAPNHRPELLTALRHAAPQATFEIL